MREKIIRGVAGMLIIAGVLLSQMLDIHWLWLSVFVGVNLFQSSLTGFCPLEKILERVGVGKEEDR